MTHIDLNKKLPTTNKIGNFDNRIGWSRRTQSDGRPSYSLWRCLHGNRYLIHAYTISSSRWCVAQELKFCRAILRRVCDHANGADLVLDANQIDLVHVSRYIKGRVEYEGDKAGPKSDSYFEKWLISLQRIFLDNDIDHDASSDFITDNIRQLRRVCENLESHEGIISAYKKLYQSRLKLKS